MPRLVPALALALVLVACSHASHKQKDAVYQTYGVHNAPGISPCTYKNCRYVRGPGEPADPIYPEYWTSRWTMYRVFNDYVNNPPPYDGRPPMREGVDYEVSYGASY